MAASSSSTASSSSFKSKDEKKQFFDTLYSYDREDDQQPLPQEDIELSRQFREAKLFSRHRKQIPSLRHRQTEPITPSVAASISIPPTSSSSTSSRQFSSVRTIASLVRANTAPESGKMPPRVNSNASRQAPPAKRRKVDSISTPLPEEQQVFRGLVFFFVRNEDKNPLRKKRMDVCRKHGATVARELDQSVTHITTDSDLVYNDVLQYLKKELKIESIPSHAKLVNADFVHECLSYKKILDSVYFPVKGAPKSNDSSRQNSGRTSPAAPQADDSLKVRARPDTVIIPETPSAYLQAPSTERSRSSSPAAAGSPEASTVSEHEDELQQIIRDSKKLSVTDYTRFLDDDDSSEAGDGSQSEDNSEAEQKKKKVPSSSKSSGWVPKGFQCMEKHDGTGKKKGPNAHTIEILTQMKEHYELVKDEWRPIAYRKAIAALARQDKLISTYDEARAIYGIGDRLALKVQEIVTTGRLERLEYAKLDPTDQILKTLSDVYGVGLANARKLMAAGYKSLDDLRRNSDKLTPNQRIGLEHYDDFNTRIPRAEVTKHGEIVSKAAEAVDPMVQTFIMGSYRRGAQDCGDIDIIVTKPNANITELKGILDELVSMLFAQKFLMCGLAVAKKDDGSKWHGACQIGAKTNPWRRIDLLLVPWDEMGAALLYFTGNDIFNRSIRLLASKKGYRLNQRGLYKDVLRGSRREKWTEGTLVESRSEMRIFEILGVPYRPPEHRIP